MSADQFLPSSPLTDRERRILDANHADMETCPHPDCDLTVDVCDVLSDGTLYVSHEEDGVGLDSRTPRGETDGCRVPKKADPTLEGGDRGTR